MAVAAGSIGLAAHGDDERELVAAVRSGDDRAFEALYARYRARIGAYVLGMVADHGRAEDIAQDVFISALRRLRATDAPVIFKPWLYEIAKNACIDEHRRRRRAREVPLESDDQRDEVGRLLSLSPTPDAAIESKQRLDDLRGAFRGLSEHHHRILVLRELEGLSYNQIGDRLGLTKPVVESTLFRARRRLGEEFAEIESGRRCARVQELIAASSARPLTSLGLRDRRLVSRHLDDCDACRRDARHAGVDRLEPPPPGKVGKVAAAASAPVDWLRTRKPHREPESDATTERAAAAPRPGVTLASVPDPPAVEPDGPPATPSPPGLSPVGRRGDSAVARRGTSSVKRESPRAVAPRMSA